MKKREMMTKREMLLERHIVILNYGFTTVDDETQLNCASCVNDGVNRIKFAGRTFYEYRGRDEAPCRF